MQTESPVAHSVDILASSRIAALSALLGHASSPQDGEPLPALRHWIFFWDTVPQAELGSDGYRHIADEQAKQWAPQHMWAGSRMRFHAPLRVGAAAERFVRTIGSRSTTGSRGRLTFVTTRHTIEQFGKPVIEEERDIVHIEPIDDMPRAKSLAPIAVEADAVWTRIIHPTEAMLFRYSALTFNAHRIHYDFPYATGVEGYPHLLVHGPLLATLLMDLLYRQVPQAVVREFNFKAIRPTFLGHSFVLCGRPLGDGHTFSLWSQDHEGGLTMSAQAICATAP
jgi:3-methylfumaryl-CoA hydratase